MSLISLLVLLVVVGAVLYIVSILPIAGWVKTVINVIAAVVVFLWVLDFFGLHHGLNLRLR